jgi:uncharacterized membrane protein
MSRFKPVHAVAIVAAILTVLLLLGSGARGTRHARVAAGPDGRVRIGVADMGPERIRFYRYLSPSNQEVDFFVARDAAGTVQAAFDASENHYKLRRGLRLENGWIVDNKCGVVTRLSAVNAGGGGCSPIPLPYRMAGEEVLIDPADLLQGWRLFR